MYINFQQNWVKRFIIRLPKLRCLKNIPMVDVLGEITVEELGMNSERGRCLELLYVGVSKNGIIPHSHATFYKMRQYLQ